MRAQRVSATTVTIKVKYDNFEQVTRCRTLSYPFTALCDVLPHLSQLLERTEAGPRKVRLLGVSFSGLEAITVRNKGQMDLFAPD